MRYYLTKQALSQFIRSECLRQLRLSLTPAAQCGAERVRQGMPDEQDPRPGLQLLRAAGEKWQAEKLSDLARTFGSAALVGNAEMLPGGRVVFRKIPLEEALERTSSGVFLVESEFEITPVFEDALGLEDLRRVYDLEYADVRPDLIHVLGGEQRRRFGITTRGDVVEIPPNDSRFQLRVIEIKLTSEPSPSYFAEVSYYQIALAAWLEQHRLADRFVVVPDGAVWPGSHDASFLVKGCREAERDGITLTNAEKVALLEKDLEDLPFDVFAPRVRRFFTQDVPAALEPADWRDLEWHVDHRCKGCDYLGYPWLRREKDGTLVSTAQAAHCMPTAVAADHLSRVAFVTRGSRSALNESAVRTVAELAQRSASDSVFDVHQTLRAMRTVVSSRARSLSTDATELAPSRGTSAIMPRWADLRLYLTVDFDIGSGITFALGLSAFWLEPFDPSKHGRPRAHKRWGPYARPVDKMDLAAERREVLALLRQIAQICTWAEQANPATTIQVYIWDEVQYEHLTRIMGRHLEAILAEDATLSRLAWLFPPDELVPNATTATRMTPITQVRDVVRSVLAVPVAHYYSLLQVARHYHEEGLPESIARFNVHPLFEDLLSDQIPSERAHEIWTNQTEPNHWTVQQRRLIETVEKRLKALETLTKRLETDLRPNLGKTAPPVRTVGPLPAQDRLSVDGQLWYAYAKLNAALQQLDVEQIWAMPPHEREARFKSAHLTERLEGARRRQALAVLGLKPDPTLWVYRMSDGSREVRAREGDFNFALCPANDLSFLDTPLMSAARAVGWEPPIGDAKWRRRLADFTGITIVALDRDQGLIALRPKPFYNLSVADLEHHNIADFSRNVMLDPTFHDYFTDKLLATLRAIGNPDIAVAQRLATSYTGPTKRARRKKKTPVAEFLWDAPAMYRAPVRRNLAPLRATLEAGEYRMNDSQWGAWREALTRRLSVIWGPPGTGKSRTARAIVFSALECAHRDGAAIRVLVCAATYRALDNVLLDVYKLTGNISPGLLVQIKRLRSYTTPDDPLVPAAIDLKLNARDPSADARALRRRLEHKMGITLVGATPSQVHNLLAIDGGEPLAELFDLILIDEASQMDVAQSILAIAALAEGGSVVLAGDPKQLPPIHPAEAPKDLEDVVGSVYAFTAGRHGIPHVALEVNYRSNSTIVSFAHRAGYESKLRSEYPDLRLNLVEPIPTMRPADWPAHLPWTEEWATLLDPAISAACFVYPEGRSSQWNRFEADAVAAMIRLLYGRVADHPVNDGSGIVSTVPYAPERFWEKAIGVVTPHRAQQGLIVSRLQHSFPGVRPALIRDAVDTVERFQGQERDVIIATFALGDPDAIATEDEFLLSLNRFNVMASRARAKLIVLVTQEVVNHLCTDLKALRDSRLLKTFVDSFCRVARPMELPNLTAGVPVRGQFRHH